MTRSYGKVKVKRAKPGLDEVPEDCVEDLQAAIDYLNKCPYKLEPNHLPKASIDILKKKHGRNKPTE